MKLIMEVDLEEVPQIGQMMLLINETMKQWLESPAGRIMLDGLVRDKHCWIPEKNVGMLAEATDEDGNNVWLRIAVTDSPFDKAKWGLLLKEADPSRYDVQVIRAEK